MIKPKAVFVAHEFLRSTAPIELKICKHLGTLKRLYVYPLYTYIHMCVYISSGAGRFI